MKRLTAIVLSLAMVCSFLFSPILMNVSIASTINYDVRGGQLIFDPTRGYIVGYTGDPVNLAVPAEINGIKVKGIGLGAFTGCKSLTKVTLPEGLTTIEDRVFWDCKNLTSVNIPDSVTSIGEWFAIYCNSLGSITVGAGNQNFTAKDGVLFNKDKTVLLRYPGGKSGAYTIPDTVKIIANGAFYGCSHITGVSIQNGVTSIGNEAFTNCFMLGDISLPDSLETLGFGVFRATSANRISVGANNEYFSSVDGVLFNKDKTTLLAFPNMRAGSYEVPEGVTAIFDSSFASSQYLTDVHIPKSVERIGMMAFWYCTGLKLAYFYGDAPSISEYAFDHVSPDFKVIYYSGKKGFSNPWYGYPSEARQQNLPDLTITDINWSPQQPVQGDEVTFSVTVKNQGTQPFAAGMMESVDFYVDGQPVTAAGSNKTVIKPGESLTMTADSNRYGKTVWTAANGTYKISARLNSNADESNTDNNTYEKTVVISQFREVSTWAVGYLEIAVNIGFVVDVLKGRAMSSGITREEFAELSVKFYERVTGKTAALPVGKSFVDCNNPEVLKAFALNITAGVGDGSKFEPKALLSRQQMATMISKTLKACFPGIVLDTTGQPNFKDQSKFAAYATEPAKFMAKYGITVGDGKGNFEPNSVCTIEQTIIFLVKAYQLKEDYSYQLPTSDV